MTTITKTQLLEELARRSFYEDAEIERIDDGWKVTNSYAVHTPEELVWTYEGGMKFNRQPTISAPLQEPYNSATPEFIAYWMDELLEGMVDGDRVEFAYLIAYKDDVSWDYELGNFVDQYGEPTDNFAGWTIAAYKKADD